MLIEFIPPSEYIKARKSDAYVDFLSNLSLPTMSVLGIIWEEVKLSYQEFSYFSKYADPSIEKELNPKWYDYLKVPAEDAIDTLTGKAVKKHGGEQAETLYDHLTTSKDLADDANSYTTKFTATDPVFGFRIGVKYGKDYFTEGITTLTCDVNYFGYHSTEGSNGVTITAPKYPPSVQLKQEDSIIIDYSAIEDYLKNPKKSSDDSADDQTKRKGKYTFNFSE